MPQRFRFVEFFLSYMEWADVIMMTLSSSSTARNRMQAACELLKYFREFYEYCATCEVSVINSASIHLLMSNQSAY